jgi:NADP-dependent aldehyde dehydrogenase
MLRLLVTGAAGRMGTALRPLLARPGRTLRLTDLASIPDGTDGAEIRRLDLTDADAVADACRDVDAILHLGGITREAPLDELMRVNVNGTANVLEGARRAAVDRVVLASSAHAVGFYSMADAGPDGLLPDDLPPRPDTFYGWSKAAAEALGSLYHDRFGMHVIALRIGTCFAEPIGRRARDGWLSHADAARLVEACLSAPDPGFRVVWGVSANARRWWSLRAAGELGYVARDNAETVLVPETSAVPEDPATTWVGADFVDHPLGQKR